MRMKNVKVGYIPQVLLFLCFFRHLIPSPTLSINMDPLSVIGGISAIASIAGSFIKIYKQIQGYRNIFKTAKDDLSMLSSEVLQYQITMGIAYRTLENEETKTFSSEERGNLAQVIDCAKKLQEEMEAFLDVEIRKLVTDRDEIYILRTLKDIWLGKHWKAAQPRLAFLKWWLMSSKVTLQLLIDLFILRKLNELLQRHPDPLSPDPERVARITEDM